MPRKSKETKVCSPGLDSNSNYATSVDEKLLKAEGINADSIPKELEADETSQSLLAGDSLPNIHSAIHTSSSVYSTEL
ncbi:hypothetical protein EB796_020750 [Bugula neritina]|uniref:Uncharacterized protein n=1 Tax=Bugula neritina TaxID=10212 RepID=A0A7J7J4Z7_BUGNE|nr:hypothetical protein EB796_020750 [Bugula neritina]